MWREWKDKPREDWTNSAKKVCDKEPVFRIYRELLKLNNNKTQLKKWAMFERIFQQWRNKDDK